MLFMIVSIGCLLFFIAGKGHMVLRWMKYSVQKEDRRIYAVKLSAKSNCGRGFQSRNIVTERKGGQGHLYLVIMSLYLTCHTTSPKIG
jgi:hypothetical protein